MGKGEKFLYVTCREDGSLLDNGNIAVWGGPNGSHDPVPPLRGLSMRRAPDDLLEWVLTPMHGEPLNWPRNPASLKAKVEGGWAYSSSEGGIFVPIAGAAGITIVGSEEA